MTLTDRDLIGWAGAIVGAACLIAAAFFKGGLVPGLEAAGYSLTALSSVWMGSATLQQFMGKK